jgi:outer membrane protein assembly factor BamA
MKNKIVLLVLLAFVTLNAQEKEHTGWGWGGVPAINYNADDGFGYGFVLNFFNYKDGSYKPYYYKINPIVFATTGGKQDHTLFFDSPYLLGHGFRFNIRLRFLLEDYYPYYGLGNDSEFNPDFIDEDNSDNPSLYRGKHYYTFQSDQIKFFANFQRAFAYRDNGKPKVSVLFGLGIVNVSNSYNKNENIKTRLEEDVESGIITEDEFNGGMNNFLKFGLIYDTRDNEPAPNRGIWTELLSEFYTNLVGSDYNFTRLTLTDRRYFQILDNLVYANRIVLENLFGDPPLNMLYPYGSSIMADEGLGGYRSIRGVYKNRYIGTTKFFMNMELRYRFYEFSLFNQDFYLATNIFCDLGRVWYDESIDSIDNLHAGYGIGLHVGWNENFIFYGDLGFSKEAGSQLYVDIGYLF